MDLPPWDTLDPEQQRRALARGRYLALLAQDGLITSDEREECGAYHALPAEDPRAAACEAAYPK